MRQICCNLAKMRLHHFAALTHGAAGLMLADERGIAMRLSVSCVVLAVGLGACASDPQEEVATSPVQTSCSYGVARWGAFDEAGQSNTQTAAKAQEAAKLIKTGQRWRLTHEYLHEMPEFPFPGLLGFQLSILGPVQFDAALIGQEEQVHSEIGQVGTQMDTLGHMCFLHNGATDPGDADCYGGFKLRDVVFPTGLAHLGIDKIKPYFTRGILVDVPRYLNGGHRLAPGQPITATMIAQTLAAQALSVDSIEEGEVVLVRTGQEELWYPGSTSFYGATPGLDLSAAQLLASRCVGNIGADNWPVEVVPHVDTVPSGTGFPVHEFDLSQAGIPQLEIVKLAELANALAAEYAQNHDGSPYVFAFVQVPMPMTGATGSPATILAIQ